jgi:hypothetical protein
VGKSWLGSAEVVIRQICGLNDITPGHERVTISPSICDTFVCIAVFSKVNKERNSLVVDAEVKAIISENANEKDVVI